MAGRASIGAKCIVSSLVIYAEITLVWKLYCAVLLCNVECRWKITLLFVSMLNLWLHMQNPYCRSYRAGTRNMMLTFDGRLIYRALTYIAVPFLGPQQPRYIGLTLYHLFGMYVYIISYPLFASADTKIYPHTASQYHTRPKAKCGIAMLSVDKFPYPRKQTRCNEFIPCSNDVRQIIKCFCSFEISDTPFIPLYFTLVSQSEARVSTEHNLCHVTVLIFTCPHCLHVFCSTMQSEYKMNYQAPLEYRYEHGAWKGADPPHLQTAKVCRTFQET